MFTTVNLKLPLPAALSSDVPTGREIRSCEALEAWLKTASPASEGVDLEPPKAALKRLFGLFKAWSAPHDFHMFVSGSYRLGVYTKDADIDVVFVTTSAIKRAAVFRNFVDVLFETEGVTDIQSVPQARVPIISMRIDGQEFDVLTCHLGTKALPTRTALLQSYDWMNNVDEASVLAFSATRVTEVLIHSVPRWQQYTTALRFLRLWAKRRCIYSNKAGYLGGVNVALLTAFVARLYPNATASTLVAKFFEMFAEWRWGGGNPVRMHDMADCPVWLTACEWTMHVGEAMVVLTPCYPQTNSMFSASTTTCVVMHREFQRGAHLLVSKDGRYGAEDPKTWQTVCAPLAALATCTRFLRVTVSAPNTTQGRSWQGYMESQTRHLVQYLSKQELAVREFRYLPVWVTRPAVTVTATATQPESSTDVKHGRADTVFRETYICAEDDGKIRTYVVRGRTDVPLEYFMRMHAENGPVRPRGTNVKLDFIENPDVLPAAFVEYDRDTLLGFTAEEPVIPPSEVSCEAATTACAGSSTGTPKPVIEHMMFYGGMPAAAPPAATRERKRLRIVEPLRTTADGGPFMFKRKTWPFAAHTPV